MVAAGLHQVGLPTGSFRQRAAPAARQTVRRWRPCPRWGCVVRGHHRRSRARGHGRGRARRRVEAAIPLRVQPIPRRQSRAPAVYLEVQQFRLRRQAACVASAPPHPSRVAGHGRGPVAAAVAARQRLARPTPAALPSRQELRTQRRMARPSSHRFTMRRAGCPCNPTLRRAGHTREW